MNLEPMGADVSCGVCGVNAVVTDLDPVRLEHLLQTFSSLHEHSGAERVAWYLADEEQEEDA